MALRQPDRPPWRLVAAILGSFVVGSTEAVFAELPYCHVQAPGEHTGLIYQFRRHVLGRDPIAEFKTNQCDACKHVMQSYFETSPAMYDVPHPVGVTELLERGDYCHQVVMIKLGYTDNFYDPHESDFWLGMDQNLLRQQHCMEFFNAFLDHAAFAPGQANETRSEYEDDFVFVANNGLHVLGFFKQGLGFHESWESCPFSEHYPTSGIKQGPLNLTMGRYLSARRTSGTDFPGCGYVPRPNGVEGVLREDVMNEYRDLGFRRPMMRSDAPYGSRPPRGIDSTVPVFDDHPCAHLGCCDVELWRDSFDRVE